MFLKGFSPRASTFLLRMKRLWCPDRIASPSYVLFSSYCIFFSCVNLDLQGQPQIQTQIKVNTDRRRGRLTDRGRGKGTLTDRGRGKGGLTDRRRGKGRLTDSQIGRREQFALVSNSRGARV